MVSKRVNLGLSLGLSAAHVQREGPLDSVTTSEVGQTAWSVTVEPALKWYITAPRTVAAYLHVAAGPSFTWTRESGSGGSASRACGSSSRAPDTTTPTGRVW
jgi:hypothetical protein